ncbi:RagB/SusD family nutrient uptake outer membrane protein [Dyadobacter sp. LHD-138]|uniref:RagB/SusD family nutrient uptake outer membrane protein n=1 Tax=Dyadobacter sp. LHD-138 TaxID=3071413 RepID=UPI0027E1947E|nr:RagB/SusD family nutrient uptake outer membrane protein [Dyadobacter sp. LHD-138]MDQ6482081.1 RagB/SusD family nutrient uptake outer membrane protein [Dyadobacter sp. LHD-138]
MKKIFQITLFMFLAGASGCNDDKFLNTEPLSDLTTEEVFSSSPQVFSILANLYNRQPDFSSVKSWMSMADFSESFISDNGGDQVAVLRRNSWNYDAWNNWDYAYIRDINLFLERAESATVLSEADKKRFLAEARFLRANYYFELVKRMGGVPIITKALVYDNSGNTEALQFPRAKEHEVYDFVISEAEAIKNLLPTDANQKGRATKAAALAMEARAALYAASIAKYGSNTPLVNLPGGEVGIPATMASGYYTKALAAAKEIISGTAGAYALYNKKPNDLQDNFASIFYDKGNNPESIWIEDFQLKTVKVHGFSVSNQPRFGAEEEEGGRINPSLNLVQAFEKLDNTFAPIPVKDGSGNPIYYAKQADAFAGRDARLGGTVILPGTAFKLRPVDIWAGYQLPNGSILSGDDRGSQRPLPDGSTAQVVGFDGPIVGKEHTAQTGFYIRKYLDPAIGSGSRGTQSEIPFIRYRYAEVLLNAAEASFELGKTADAAEYMNRVRTRAGLIIPLTAGDITFDRIVHERRVELAFEGHLLYDMKRWRLAHQIWDGERLAESELLSNIGKANKKSTQPYSLLPYKIYNPGQPNHNQWIYKVALSNLVTGANRFRLGNYYSFINDDIRSRNPKIVRQPNQD